VDEGTTAAALRTARALLPEGLPPGPVGRGAGAGVWGLYVAARQEVIVVLPAGQSVDTAELLACVADLVRDVP